MAESEPEVINGGDVKRGVHLSYDDQEIDLCSVIRRMISTIFTSSDHRPVMQRIKIAVTENFPLLKDASRNSGKKLVQWTRRGSPLRALLVISVGTIAFLALTGLLVFMLFFAAATVNAIVISLLMSLAAAGGFLALFFACVTAVYIGALSVAIFVISTATIAAIVAVVITTGWIGFFWIIWLAMKKSVGVAKHSLSVTGSAISAYSSSRHGRRYHELNKVEN